MSQERRLKIYMVTGEPSGDLLGSRLMHALKNEADVSFAGVGGESMQAEGMETLFPISDLAVMGIFEVIPHLPKILGRIKQTLDDIEAKKPDIVVTVDSWSFSKQIHLGLIKRGIKVPHIHYVAPQVWAWKSSRAKQIKKWVDHLLMLLPFEAKYFAPYGVAYTYVGHPVIEGGSDKGNAARFVTMHNLSQKDFILTILPGSRKTEIKYLLPVFEQVVEKMAQLHPNLKVVLPTVETVKDKIEKAIAHWKVPVLIVTGEMARYDAFAASTMALAASGTVSLELAMAGTPHIIAYKMNKLTGWVAGYLLRKKIKYVNLINILSDEQIIPECLQDACNLDKIMLELDKLQGQGGKVQMQKARKALEMLGAGEALTPSQKAAKEVLKIIKASTK